MPNKDITTADYYRRNSVIINATTGELEVLPSINQAKKRSKELQQEGKRVVVLSPKATIKGRY